MSAWEEIPESAGFTYVPVGGQGPMGDLSTWEGRMAYRAAARRLAAEAEEELRRRAEDPHADHHTHLVGTAVECSCGEFFGVTCVAIPDDPEALRCHVCGEPGVVSMAPLPEPESETPS